MTFGNAQNETRKAIIDAITAHAVNRPRAQQVEVGPSGIGVSCERQLGYRLLNIGKTRLQGAAPWMPQIGTAVHTYLETIFAPLDRYMTETPVVIKYKDLEIPGTVDLYDRETNTVIDFKLTGEAGINNARRGNTSAQYQVQVQLYAKGLQQAGFAVDNVAILFLPRNKELTDSVMWQSAYEPQIAEMYLNRYNLIKNVTAVNNVKALTMLDTADAPCVWCDWYNPNAKTPADGCTGHRNQQTK